MSELSPPASRLSRFRGVHALFLEKRRSLVRLPLWLGLPMGIATSFLARVNHAEPVNLAWIAFVAMVLCAGIAPLFAAAFVTLTGNQVGTRSRRDELLALPLGRLAIPAATLLVSLTLALATYGVFLAGFSFFLGRESVLAAVLSAPVDGELPFTALGRLKGALGVFAAMWSLVTIAHQSSVTLMLLGVTGTLLGFLPVIAGYDEATMVAYVKVWLACMTGYWLVLPFVLYSRSPHHWVLIRSQSRLVPAGSPAAHDGPASPALLASCAALVLLLGYLGAGKAVAAALLAGALFVYRAHRRLPPAERRAPSHTAVSLVLGLVFVAPPVVLGLVTDARHYAEAARPLPEVACYAVSPDGRHVAACFQPDGLRGLSRVLVADLGEKEPVLTLPPRYALLEDACCWSKDGRYLAVHEVTAGRVVIPFSLSSAMTWTYGAEVASFDQFVERQGGRLMRSLQGTWILDTRTGKLEERPLVVLAPGWSTPDELVHLSPRTFGGCDIEDGRGHAAFWDQPSLSIDGYSSEGVELLAGVERPPSEKGRFLFGASGIAPVATGSRWETTVGPDYPEPGVPEGEARKLRDVTFSKGARSLTAKGCLSALVTLVVRLDEKLVLVHKPVGSVVLDLETGEERLDWRREKKSHSALYCPLWRSAYGDTRFVGEHPQEIARAPGGPPSLLDPRTRATMPLASFPGFAPERVAGTRVFGRLEGKGLAVQEGSSEPRPVF